MYAHWLLSDGPATAQLVLCIILAGLVLRSLLSISGELLYLGVYTAAFLVFLNGVSPSASEAFMDTARQFGVPFTNGTLRTTVDLIRKARHLLYPH